MSDSEHDDEFEAYLKRRAPIDERLRGRKQIEPPPELDRIVIGNARKAIRGVASIHVYRAPKWALPVSLAAVLVLSFAILLDLGVRARRREVMAQAPPTPQAMATDGSSAAAATAPVAVPPIATKPWPPSSPGATPVSPSAKARTNATGETVSDQARTRFAHVEVAAKRSRMDTYAEPAPDVSNSISRQSAGLESVEVTAARRTQNDASSAASVLTLAEAEPISTVSVDLSSALASAASSARAAIDGGPDPAAWLAEIEKIRDHGHEAQADREIKRFQKTYPDYPLPASMSDR